MDTATLKLVFHGDLKTLLRGAHINGVVDYRLSRRASLKDIIESLAIPHTEIWQVHYAGNSEDLSAVPERGGRYDISPFSFSKSHTLRQELEKMYPEGIRFLIDTTALKLAR